ncbi:succinate--CoA ligase subunit alpha [Sulfolobales archaeon HS-7]|nr:succinate--CoA ligase subunit alpha [Sulfolobales archaeon HS-7]
MRNYGTKVVAGVTPGKGGTEIEGIPVYDNVADAVKEHNIEASIVFVPGKFAADAVYEALDSGINLVVVITEHIPVLDTMRFVKYAKNKGARIIGPNCPGIMVPEQISLGIMPPRAFKKGKIGIASRSGTLTYEVANDLKHIGQSTVIGVGGDPIIGTDLVDAALAFEEDPETEKIVVIGEIGGTSEERLASLVKRGKIKKKIVAYIAGLTAPREKRMGHAGAVVYMGMGSFQSKVTAFKEADISVAQTPFDIKKLL